MATYNETRVNLGKVIDFESDGKTPKTDPKTNEVVTTTEENLTEKKAQEISAAQKTAGQEEPEQTKVQTFQITEVDEPEQLTTILSQYNQNPDEVKKVAIAIINRGLVLAQQKAMREFMLDADQGAQEGVYDLMNDACKPGEGRRKADPRSQAAKAMSALLGRTVTVDEVDALLASFGQAQAPAAAAPAAQ